MYSYRDIKEVDSMGIYDAVMSILRHVGTCLCEICFF